MGSDSVAARGVSPLRARARDSVLFFLTHAHTTRCSPPQERDILTVTQEVSVSARNCLGMGTESVLGSCLTRGRAAVSGGGADLPCPPESRG